MNHVISYTVLGIDQISAVLRGITQNIHRMATGFRTATVAMKANILIMSLTILVQLAQAAKNAFDRWKLKDQVQGANEAITHLWERLTKIASTKMDSLVKELQRVTAEMRSQRDLLLSFSADAARYGSAVAARQKAEAALVGPTAVEAQERAARMGAQRASVSDAGIQAGAAADEATRKKAAAERARSDYDKAAGEWGTKRGTAQEDKMRVDALKAMRENVEKMEIEASQAQRTSQAAQNRLETEKRILEELEKQIRAEIELDKKKKDADARAAATLAAEKKAATERSAAMTEVEGRAQAADQKARNARGQFQNIMGGMMPNAAEVALGKDPDFQDMPFEQRLAILTTRGALRQWKADNRSRDRMQTRLENLAKGRGWKAEQARQLLKDAAAAVEADAAAKKADQAAVESRDLLRQIRDNLTLG